MIGEPNNRWALVADRDEASSALVCQLVGQIGFAAVTVQSGADALAATRGELPALIVIDVDIANPWAYEVCRELREQFGEALPIVFTSATRTSPQDEIAGLLLGADAYLNKPLQAELFLARVRRLVARAPTLVARTALTAREREVLSLLVDGRRRSEVAEILCITPKTAATHIDHILVKLGAHSQAQAVAFAVRGNILSTSG